MQVDIRTSHLMLALAIFLFIYTAIMPYKSVFPWLMTAFAFIVTILVAIGEDLDDIKKQLKVRR